MQTFTNLIKNTCAMKNNGIYADILLNPYLKFYYACLIFFKLYLLSHIILLAILLQIYNLMSSFLLLAYVVLSLILWMGQNIFIISWLIDFNSMSTHYFMPRG